MSLKVIYLSQDFSSAGFVYNTAVGVMQRVAIARFLVNVHMPLVLMQVIFPKTSNNGFVSAVFRPIKSHLCGV